MSVHAQWEEFLSPEILKDKIISASMTLIAYELLKDSIIERIKDFYSNGFNQNGPIVDEEYQEQVVGLNKSILYASLDWLKSHEVITEDYLLKFEKAKKARNSLAHELSLLVSKGIDVDVGESFDTIFFLLRKIEVWWIVNVELATNPDYNEEEVDVDGIIPGPILSIQMMLLVLSGNQELLKTYRSASRKNAD